MVKLTKISKRLAARRKMFDANPPRGDKPARKRPGSNKK